MKVAEVIREADASRLARYYEQEWIVIGREEQIEDNPPPAPYTTAELLEEAAVRLGWNASQTMGAAQRLYESGYITYPRTDSQRVSSSASEKARQVIVARYGVAALGKSFPYLSGNGQDAHEAIRPSDPTRDPDSLAVPPQEQALYRLIYQRFLAAHMRPARIKVVSLTLELLEEKSADA
jgi:DNA topoisomerase-1